MSLPAARTLKVYAEALTTLRVLCRGYLEGSLHTPLFSQGHVLETAPTAETVGRMYISRTEEGFPIAWIQPVGQPAVTSSRRPPTGLHHLF